jgi:hypothetical protein
MARRVFFSFHYQDVIDFRANTIRKSWVTKKDRASAGFFDASIWEEAKKTSTLALKRLINKGLKDTSITVVLIGSDTYDRIWVQYEIFKSIYNSNKVLGVHINKINGKNGQIKNYGNNPFEYLAFEYSADGKSITPMVWNGKNWIKYLHLEDWILKIPKTNLGGKIVKLSNEYNTYCWIKNDGYNNFASWIS